MFTGGGTAGHVYPLIAIIREIKKQYSQNDLHFFYVGPKDDFAAALLTKEGVYIKTIFAGKLRRYFSFQNFVDIFFKFPAGFFQAFYHIFVISPDLIFSKGGYGSLPAVFAGRILMTPIFLHESDIVPGMANKIAARFAVEIFTAFPAEKTGAFPAGKMICVGNPIRKELFLPQEKDTIRLNGNRPLLLIIGGSQGAQIINERVMTVLEQLTKEFEIIHQVGQLNFQTIKDDSNVIFGEHDEKMFYHIFPFLNEEELRFAYAKANLIISRAGAGSVFEIAAAGKPSILIPLANAAQNHQVRNAYAYSELGAAIVLEEANFTPRFFLERIKFLFDNPQKLETMSKKAKEFSKPEAAELIAQYIIAYLS